MAKDMLDAIFAAENDAKTKEAEAKQQAAQLIAKAKKDAAQLITKRGQEAQQAADEDLKNAKLQGEMSIKMAEDAAQKECDKISAVAEKNRANVIKKAADALLS